MKYPLGIVLCCLLATGAFAQRRGGMGHAGFTGGVRAGSRMGYTRAPANLRYSGGFRDFRGLREFRPRLGSFWPWFYGYGGFWDGPDYASDYPNPASYESSPNVTVIYGPPAPPVYPTVINLTAHPVMHEYRQPEDYGLPSEHQSQPILYLIAFKDRVIRAATTYWVENDRLHYLDLDHKQKEAPLASIDRDFSAQLNRERHVPFGL